MSSVFPIETDFTALILIIAFAKSASNLSNTGAPRPTGQFSIVTPSLAPTEFPYVINSANKSSNSGNFDASEKKYLLLLLSVWLILSALITPI